jgi:hypothetical protein
MNPTDPVNFQRDGDTPQRINRAAAQANRQERAGCCTHPVKTRVENKEDFRSGGGGDELGTVTPRRTNPANTRNKLRETLAGSTRKSK